jgi:hypothetical protein
MILILALLLAAAGLRAEEGQASINRVVTVDASDFKGLRFAVKNRPGTVEVRYEVSSNPGRVRLILIPRSEEEMFRAGQKYNEIVSTPFETSGVLRAHIATPGDYLLMVDNRQQLRIPATVKLEGKLTYDLAPAHARTLTPERRILVIASSIGLFFAITLLAGRRLWRAASAQKGADASSGTESRL